MSEDRKPTTSDNALAIVFGVILIAGTAIGYGSTSGGFVGFIAALLVALLIALVIVGGISIGLGINRKLND